MDLKKLEVVTKCDNGVCQNFADYTVEREGTPRSMQLNLCTDCVKELNGLFEKMQNGKKTKRSKEICGKV